MSRARPIEINGEKLWFDTRGAKATEEQLEILATLHEVGEEVDDGEELDDILDADLTQAKVLELLRRALGQGVPPEVEKKREEWRKQRATAPPCRICGREGDSTKHHFVNKWILKELDKYASRWADRRKNCIPLCITCHRDIHSRSNGPNSIAEHLTDTEKRFAHRALDAFVTERPAVAWLVIRGDESVYETKLMRDWIDGRFQVDAAEEQIPAHELLAA